MRHQINGRRLGRYSGHRMMLYRNLVTDLLKNEKLTTTSTGQAGEKWINYQETRR